MNADNQQHEAWVLEQRGYGFESCEGQNLTFFAFFKLEKKLFEWK